MNLYNSIKIIGKEMAERRDCTVIAATVVTGAPYQKVHALMTQQGRRRGCGTTINNMETVINTLGFKMVNIGAQVNATTVRAVAAELPEGDFIVSVSGHVLAVNDGVVEDWSAQGLKRVRTVWQVLPAGAPADAIRQPPAPQPIVLRRQSDNVRSVIWAHADKVWSTEGKPTGVELRKLRITMMDQLGKIGVKRTTASTELGKWQKSKGL